MNRELIPIVVNVDVEESTQVYALGIESSIIDVSLDIATSIQTSSASHYTGEYTVTPGLYEQSLDTDGKIMDEDVTVHQIPITRATNPHGGQTVLIG